MKHYAGLLGGFRIVGGLFGVPALHSIKSEVFETSEKFERRFVPFFPPFTALKIRPSRETVAVSVFLPVARDPVRAVAVAKLVVVRNWRREWEVFICK
jgi:hypothetical protein